MPLDGIAALREAWARGLAAPPTRGPDEWADAERILGAEEGPYPGQWSTARVPYLREVMQAMGFDHPARRITLMASAQVGKTMAALNFCGQVAAERPATILLVVPSLDEARAFNREKLEPMLSNTPAVAKRVRALVSRDETGSTTMNKRFPDGSIELTGANSSKGLQMRTKRAVYMDEISEFPLDVDGRGDPVTMAEARTIAWTGREKIIATSTPGMKGSCRISVRWEAGSRGRFHVPCPHPECGHMQSLELKNLRSPTALEPRAVYVCDGCGADIEHRQKAGMLATGRWVHEAPELVSSHASYRLNALYSPFVSWDWVAQQRDDARDDPAKEKVYTQQVAGEAYEPRYDLPSHEVLWRRRENWPKGRIPPGVLFLVGSVDVQGNRLEWAVYGFDRHFGQYWIDGDIIQGDPNLDPVWYELDAVMARRYVDAWGAEWPVQAYGVDSGYLSPRVYGFARRHAHRAEPRVMALDGRHRWGEPPLGAPKKVDVDYNGSKIGETLIWPVGTWDLKSELATALGLTEKGPDEAGIWPRGAMRFPQRLDIGFFEEMTSEACVEVGNRAGFTRREWRKLRKNEQWDLAVYARAIARHETAAFVEATWDSLTAQRLAPPEKAQADMAGLWAPDLKAEADRVLAARQASQPPGGPEPAAEAAPRTWDAPPAWESPAGW